MTRRPASPKPPKGAPDPRAHMKVGDTVMLGPAYIDPVHWFLGTVEWISGDRGEILVHQYGIAGTNPHNQLHDIDYVRVFGTTKHCGEQKHKAATAVRDAARLVNRLEDLARDLQRRMAEVFEQLATAALKSCGAEP